MYPTYAESFAYLLCSISSAVTEDRHVQIIQDIQKNEFIKKRYMGFDGTSFIVRWLVSFFFFYFNKIVFLTKNPRRYVFVNLL